jgi:transcriptional regulator with XRE-family HTH domain
MRATTPDEEWKQDDDRRFERFCRWLARQPDLATALRSLRTVRGMSLREAAFHAQRSAAYLDRIERSQRTPERDTLVALCVRAYDLTVRETGRVLLLAAYAPLHHEQLAVAPPPESKDQWEVDTKAGDISHSG